MQEARSQKPQPDDVLAVQPPILAVGTRDVYLFAYPTLDTAVKKINDDFLAGGYGKIHGAFDRYQLVHDLSFFDAAGQELEPDWASNVQPPRENDTGYRVSTFKVKNGKEYVRSRFWAMLQQVAPTIEQKPDKLLKELGSFDDFRGLCSRFVYVLSDSYADGFWHRVFGGD